MLTKIGSLSGGFGSFQKEVRLNGRLYLGVGHTPAEAHRNAWDAVKDRCGDSVEGLVSVMRQHPIRGSVVRSTKGVSNVS